MRTCCLFFAMAAAWAQTGPRGPGLFFREDWNRKEPFEQVTQEHVANPELIQTVWGPGGAGLKKRHHGRDDEPYYIWSGACPGHWALTLRHRSADADLTGRARIRWRTMQSGFRRLHVVVKPANGPWLVSEQATGESSDWVETEWVVADLRWRKLDIQEVFEDLPVERPDLSRVEEIGFTDLMRGMPSPAGRSSPAASRVDWVEVYGKAVPRPAAR